MSKNTSGFLIELHTAEDYDFSTIINDGYIVEDKLMAKHKVDKLLELDNTGFVKLVEIDLNTSKKIKELLLNEDSDLSIHESTFLISSQIRENIKNIDTFIGKDFNNLGYDPLLHGANGKTFDVNLKDLVM